MVEHQDRPLTQGAVLPSNSVPRALGLDWALTRVAAFHRLAGQPAPDTPRPLDHDRAEIRAAWMREELGEFLEATSVVDQSDAIIDLMYFALGTLVEMGVPAESLFEIVHLANMRKFANGDALRRPEDGKVMKSSDWLSPEEALARELTDLTSRYRLVLADQISTAEACIQMVIQLITSVTPLDSRVLATTSTNAQLSGSPLTPVFARAGVPVTDDFEHISLIDEATFRDRISHALAIYPAVGFAYDRSFLPRGDSPSNVEFLLVASVGISEVVVVDPQPQSPGPRAVNVDHLYAAVKAAGDGLHRFGVHR